MTRATYLAVAKLWHMGGRSDMRLQSDDWQLLALQCWVTSDGARREGGNNLISEYCNTSRRAKERQSPGWYERLLAVRGACDGCQITFKVENLAICTGCMHTYCWGCTPTGKARNGNPIHVCGGEVVG